MSYEMNKRKSLWAAIHLFILWKTLRRMRKIQKTMRSYSIMLRISWTRLIVVKEGLLRNNSMAKRVSCLTKTGSQFGKLLKV